MRQHQIAHNGKPTQPHQPTSQQQPHGQPQGQPQPHGQPQSQPNGPNQAEQQAKQIVKSPQEAQKEVVNTEAKEKLETEKADNTPAQPAPTCKLRFHFHVKIPSVMLCLSMGTW